MEKGPIYNYLHKDHIILGDFLEKIIDKSGNIERSYYEKFREGILKHIGIEEKILIKSLEKKGKVPAEILKLKLDHSAISALLVPEPTKGIINTIKEILRDHNLLEEMDGGFYDECDKWLKEEVEAIIEKIKNYPPFKLMPNIPEKEVLKTTKRIVEGAGYRFQEEVQEKHFVRSAPKKEIISLFSRHISSGKVRVFTSFGMDFIIGKREGIYIWDAETGKKLINCHSNGGVFNLGHRNPRIIRVLNEALKEIDIGNHHLISEMRALLAKRLAELMPEGLSRTIFGVSGGEAVDLAIKIARGYTGRTKIISATGGYHGHTGFALATGDEKYKKPFGPLAPGFVQVPFNDPEYLEKVIDANTAAVIFETVPATLGIYVPDKGYFKKVSEMCKKNGALLILDEVQTGLGRTGKLWGFEHFDVVPDIVVLGKGLSGGIYPITATIFKEKLERVFVKDPFIHISTFGGSELGCVVAMEVLNISSSPDFLNHVNKIAEIFKRGLEKLKEEFKEIIIEIRQLGCMMGIKMKNELWGPLMTKSCYENGLLCIYANNDRSVLQVLPPLIINEEQAEEVIRRLKDSFELAREKSFQAKTLSSFMKAELKNYLYSLKMMLEELIE